nr:hypothetical protein [uncultured Mucilaginibacter sp.]
MPNHLSPLGIIHTAISILALFVAFYCLFKDGRILPSSDRGKMYIVLTTVTCLTGFPIMKTGQFTQAHGLGILVLVLLPLGMYANYIKVFGKSGQYFQVAIMSTTLFLSFVPAIVETLTRLPISHPIAASPDDVIIKTGLLTLFLLFILGVVYQFKKIRLSKISVTPAETII